MAAVFLRALIVGRCVAALERNLTIYHVNELKAGPIPRDMDVSDFGGDMFFEMHSLALPLECSTPPNVRKPFECVNAEVTSSDLVVNELVLEVDGAYGEYQKCNVCINGTDRGHPSDCVDGAYVCDCTDPPCDATAVGYANLTETVRYCVSGDPDWKCWQDTAVRKTGGSWFSMPAAGFQKTWRVAAVKNVINATCAKRTRLDAIEKLGTFDCEDSGVGPRRNGSSKCWLQSFFAIVLGPGCGEPNCVVEGADPAALRAAWALPFADPADGGCAPLTPRVAAPANRAGDARFGVGVAGDI